MEKVRKKRRKKTWVQKYKWLLLSLPIAFIIVGVAVVAFFGWDLSKQTVLLAHEVVDEYEPELPDQTFDQPWPKLPDPGSSIGELQFTSIDLTVPVVQGTHDNELKKGAGHFAGSALPGQGGNVILSGHRDTVFRKLENLKLGEQVTFDTPYGEFVYEAIDFKIVPADDMTVMVPTDYETLTLTTCYPFDFIGDAPDRYIVYTKLVSSPIIASN
jgi:sortase A